MPYSGNVHIWGTMGTLESKRELSANLACQTQGGEDKSMDMCKGDSHLGQPYVDDDNYQH